MSIRSGEFVVLSVAAFLGGAVLGAALLRATLLALVVGAASGLGPTMALRIALKRRTEKMRDQLPDVLTIMASSPRAGHSFMQALDMVAREIPQPAATEFQRLASEIRLGRPTDDALEALAMRVGSPDFRWAVLAVNIQREVGGNLAEILDNVADTLRERATIRRQIRVLTAEGRLSAWVLAALPIAIGLYMFAVNPEYIGAAVHHPHRPVHVGRGAGLLVLGILWMRKIVDIDVRDLAGSRCRIRLLRRRAGSAWRSSRAPRRRSVPSVCSSRTSEVRRNPSTCASRRCQELGQRVLIPIVAAAGRVARRVTPLDARDRVAKKLQLAGGPVGWDAERVMAFKVIGAVAGVFGGFVLSTILQPRRSSRSSRSRCSRSSGSSCPTRS